LAHRLGGIQKSLKKENLALSNQEITVVAYFEQPLADPLKLKSR
jgi:hypothetical protein